MLQIKIHRGAHTIGGTCIEVQSGNSRIILDLGLPLMGKGGTEIEEESLLNPSIANGILPNIEGLYKDQDKSVAAVLISHSHIDHYGLLNYLHPSIPVYMSNGSLAMVEVGKVFYPEKNKIYASNIQTFDHWKRFEIGPFKITSYLADHSGFDASSFLIEAEGKKIFYTGDFRGHGRKSKVLDILTAKPIQSVDCLLMEGTTLGGNHNVGFNTEDAVEDKLNEIFLKQKDTSFVMASGSNVDRLVSIYKAALRNKKTLVLDLYTYYVLEQLKTITPSLPPHKNDNVKILYLKGHADAIAENIGKDTLYSYMNRKIGVDEIVANRENMVLKLPISGMRKVAAKLIKQHPLNQAKFIFSMWSGYLAKDSCYNDFCEKYKTELQTVHVSGHAYLSDLKRLTEALKPKKLIPIHTLTGDDFDKYFDNVVRIEDGEDLSI